MKKRLTKIGLLFILILSISMILSAQDSNVVNGVIKGNTITVTFNIPEGQHQTLQEDYFFIEPDSIGGIIFEPTFYPKGIKEGELINYHHKVTLTKKFKITDKFDKNVKSLKIFAGYQFCKDSGMCFFPQEVELDLPIDANSLEKTISVDNAETGSKKAEKAKSSAADIIKFLIMAFLGGIILNVMPCVLPVLSIKAMSLVKQSQHDKKQILRSSFAYTGGILASFLVLAIVVIAIKISGEMVGWGFQFQNTTFVLILLSLIFVFGLSLFNVFIINAPGMQASAKAQSKGGLWGSFFTGIFAVLLATPCTAPLLGAALGFAFSQPPAIILAIFILVGLGLAFPFIVLGIWPKAIKMIPKPGNWMNVFEEIMGFLLMGTALFLLRTLYFLVGGENIINILWFLLVLGMASWAYGKFAGMQYSAKQRWITIIIVIFAVAFSAHTLLRFDTSKQIENNSNIDPASGWLKFSPELLQKYRDENKPVFIDFGAEWCMTCKTNETVVLYSKEIQKEFKKYNVVLMRGDNTKKSKIIGEWLQKFNRAGVPLYIFYAPKKDEPVVLPEVITKDMVKNMLEEAFEK